MATIKSARGTAPKTAQQPALRKVLTAGRWGYFLRISLSLRWAFLIASFW